MPASKANSRPTGTIFTYRVNIEEVPEEGLGLTISADAATRRALAAAYRLAAIDELEADFHVAQRGLAVFNVSGTLRARVTQICVLSLEPFDTDVVQEIDVDFGQPPARAAVPAATLLGGRGTPERDPPDAIVDGMIDVGALAAEFLALGLDPYPKKPGAEFAPLTVAEEKNERPFDVLKKLTDRS